MARSFLLFISIFVLGVFNAPAQEKILAEIQRLRPEEVEVAGFKLAQQQDVEIEALGLFQKTRRRDFMVGTAWVLNAADRTVVWSLTDAADAHDKVQKFKGTLSLSKGTYEVYYSTYPHYYRKSWHDCDDCEECEDCNEWEREWSGRSDRDWDTHSWKNWVSRLWDGRWDHRDFYDEYRDLFDDFKVVVRGRGKTLAISELEKERDTLRHRAAIALTVHRDDRYATQAFRLKKPTRLKIYALGEADREGTYDYGLLLNTDSLQRVWELSYRNSEFAGGAPKNRIFNEAVDLQAGNYVAIYASDDSHSPWRWNAAPPYDPAFYGLTIFSENAGKSAIELTEYEGLALKDAIVDFTRLRDEEFRSKGFALKRDMDVRIKALGEGFRHEMADYGWIVNASTHEKVWEMRYANTEPAGGDRKNREFDDILHLKKGNYVAYFMTDDSHSYRDWNASPPFLPELWGMAVLPADAKFRKSWVSDFVPEKDASVLAQIIRVRDDEYVKKRFSLDRDSKVRIYALGEGRSGEMFDYGWIENASTGRVVWDMSYRKTERAGGARKNRLSDEVISLPKGEYIAYYESDDSHAFNDWNANPPHDPMNWGITVSLVDKD